MALGGNCVERESEKRNLSDFRCQTSRVSDSEEGRRVNGRVCMCVYRGIEKERDHNHETVSTKGLFRLSMWHSANGNF